MSDEAKQNELLQVNLEEQLKQVDDFRTNQEAVFKELTAIGTAELKKLKSTAGEVGVLLSSGLSSSFSKIYGLKVRYSQYSASLHNFWFVLVVIIALIFSGFNCYAIRTDVGDFNSLVSKAGIVFLSSLPVYAFLIWLAYIARKNSLVSRRIQEAYSHKMLFAAAVSGMLKQIQSIREINEQKGADLMAQMTGALIRTLESDASVSIDTKKHELPISEATDGIAKVIASIAEMAPWNKNG